MNKLILTLNILFLFSCQMQAQFGCIALDANFELACLDNLPGCVAGTAPCDDATFDMLFYPSVWSFFDCQAIPAGGGNCNEYIVNGSLPVELISFGTDIQDEGIGLYWTTASEINNEGFYIEVSTDGNHWEELEFIKGNGTTELLNEYSFMHANPALGANYYRLKQIDYDGVHEYSNMKIALWRGGTEKLELVVVPNPTTDQIVPVLPFEYQESQNIDYEIYNDTGVLVKSFPNTGKTNVKLTVHDLTPGTYIIVSKADNFRHSARFVKI